MDGIPGTRYYQHLPELRAALDIARLLQEISTYPTGCLAEELRDVQNAEGSGTERGRERAPGNVERGL
jgi:hypothetical protein